MQVPTPTRSRWSIALFATILHASLARADASPAGSFPPSSQPSPSAAPPSDQQSLEPAPSQPAPPARSRYFYFGYDYGTQSLYSPLWVFVNRGYDVLQDHVAGRNVVALEYRHNAENVLDNLAHPFSRIPEFGWKNFVTQELLPLSFTKDTVR